MREYKGQALWAALAVAALALLLLLAGCGRRIVTVPVEHRDITQVNTRTVWRTEVVTVPLPGGQTRAVTADSSELRVGRARSVARLREDGKIDHSLVVDPDTVKQDVKVADHYKDSVRMVYKEVPVETIREVPRSWVKDVKAAALWCCLPLVVAGLLFILWRFHRLRLPWKR